MTNPGTPPWGGRVVMGAVPGERACYLGKGGAPGAGALSDPSTIGCRSAKVEGTLNNKQQMGHQWLIVRFVYIPVKVGLHLVTCSMNPRSGPGRFQTRVTRCVM